MSKSLKRVGMAVPVGQSPASILVPGCSSGGTSLGEGATSGLPHVATCRESQDGSGSGLALLRHLHFRLSCPRFGSCELCKCLNNKIHPGLYYPWYQNKMNNQFLELIKLKLRPLIRDPFFRAFPNAFVL